MLSSVYVLNVKFTLEQAVKVEGPSRGVALLFI